MDCSLSGTFQARVLEWVAITLSNIYTYIYIYVCIHTHNRVLTIKKDVIMPLAATWMDLGIIIVSQSVSSDAQL